MAKKSDFSAEQWEVLRDAPHLVMLSVATAGASGLFGSFKEAFAPAQVIFEASKGDNPLLREICERAELKAAQQAIRGTLKMSDLKSLQTQLQSLSADKAREAIETIRQKGSPQDVDAYRTLLVDIADRTAKAAKEGDFLGFGGEWVSENERTIIKRISEAVGAPT
jgi:hypothetical protein